MPLAVDSPPALDPRSPFLAFGTSPFMHIGSICTIHIAADGTFGLVCILSMIGPRNCAVTRQIVQHTKTRNTENTRGKSLDGLMKCQKMNIEHRTLNGKR